MVPVPDGPYDYADPNAEGAVTTVEIKPLWFGKTEVTWDAYDVFRLRLDDPTAQGGSDAQGSNEDELPPDGIARPTKPYGAPDGGFGHQDFAVLHVTYHAAHQYCAWLTKKTGRSYRLPTEAEWEYACRAGQLPAGPIEDKALLDGMAWYFDTAADATHKVASKGPNAWGLYDLLGNAGEWCSVPDSTKGALRGGSFKDMAEDVHPAARKTQKPSWNMSDPQIPKSKWWLSDGIFVSFRVVCEP
jgi:formylglycine-generating enzyme required for sulfatase activity